jgi:hypothetical protein
VALINIGFTYRYANGAVDSFKIFFKPMLASAVAVGTSKFVYTALDNTVNTKLSLIFAIFAAAAVYLSLCVMLRVITSDDIALLPFADKLKKQKKINRGT